MTSIEKKMMWAMVGLLFLLAGSLYVLRTAVIDAGGLEGIAVEAGKEAKDIYRQIKEH